MTELVYDNLADDQLLSALTTKDEVAIYRHLSIAELPDDSDLKHKLIPYVEDPQTAMIFVVAKTGMNNDWAVYHSIPNVGEFSEEGLEKIGGRAVACHYYISTCNPEATMRRGDKLSHRDAVALFPRIPQSMTYRR